MPSTPPLIRRLVPRAAVATAALAAAAAVAPAPAGAQIPDLPPVDPPPVQPTPDAVVPQPVARVTVELNAGARKDLERGAGWEAGWEAVRHGLVLDLEGADYGEADAERRGDGQTFVEGIRGSLIVLGVSPEGEVLGMWRSDPFPLAELAVGRAGRPVPLDEVAGGAIGGPVPVLGWPLADAYRPVAVTSPGEVSVEAARGAYLNHPWSDAWDEAHPMSPYQVVGIVLHAPDESSWSATGGVRDVAGAAELAVRPLLVRLAPREGGG